MARFSEWIPLWTGIDSKWLGNLLALATVVLLMVVVAQLIEMGVLRHLVNQDGITLLMATLGISYFLDGLAQLVFGSSTYKIDVGMPKDPIIVLESTFQGGLLLSLEDLYAAAIAAMLVALLTLFFQKTGTGRALRAVADDHQAAQSIGIPLNRIWVIVWSVGGLTSVPGAIVGGLIIGVGEKLSEIYIGPMVGGGIENWFAYVLALLFLLVRPQGLFGDKIIDRV